MSTPRLIVMNGPPAAGKSTIARRYVEDHLLSLRLDVDEVRGWLGRWQSRPQDAGLRARALTVAMADDHLRSGHDVVIAQLYGRTEPLEVLERTAGERGAEFHEFMLMAGLEDTLARYAERAGPRLKSGMDVENELDTVRELHRRVAAVLVTRPTTMVLEPIWGDPDATYEALKRMLDRRPASPGAGGTREVASPA